MKIPKQIMLWWYTIKTVYDNLMADTIWADWKAEYKANTIVLQKKVEWLIENEERQEQVYLHELVHWILYMMQNDLRNDEKFVELFSHFLYQYEKTKQF